MTEGERRLHGYFVRLTQEAKRAVRAVTRRRWERRVLMNPDVQAAFADEELRRMLDAQDVPLVRNAEDKARLEALMKQPAPSRNLPPPLPVDGEADV